MPKDGRTAEVVNALMDELVEFIYRREVTETELQHALDFVIRLGEAKEVMVISDALGLSTAADNVSHEQALRTKSNIPGPFYRLGAPMLEPPYRLAREEEPGTPLFFRGTVTSCDDGAPAAGALLDVWHANAAGVYDIQDPAIPDYNLRGLLRAGDDGSFELRTVIPGSYQIPHDGPVGQLLQAVGRHAYRPRHVHFTVTRDGYEPLTTQIYFPGDQYFETDSIYCAKPELVADLREVQPGDPEAAARGLNVPFAVAEFHFRIAPPTSSQSIPTHERRSSDATR